MSDELIFIKIHADREVKMHFANVYDIELKFQTPRFHHNFNVPFKWMANEATQPNTDSFVYKRAKYVSQI